MNIELLFESLTDSEQKQLVQLIMDRNPVNSGLLTACEFKAKLINNTYNPLVEGVYYGGKFLPMEYEELCDLFATFRDMGRFESCVLTKEKASKVFGDLLPMTDY